MNWFYAITIIMISRLGCKFKWRRILVFICIDVRLSEGLSMETVMIQWGHWRAVCRWACRVCKGRSHMFCPPGSRGGRDRSGACVWDAAPGRHTDELMKCYAVRLAREGERRGHPCHQSPRMELRPTAPGSAWQAGRTWGQGHIKGTECPPSAWKGGDGVKGEGLRG